MPQPANSGSIIADPRFARVRARDKAVDGSFVYAVQTTRIFCRPSCPARTAKPENMIFFADAEQAQAAGFRACKLCLPIDPRLGDPMVTRMSDMADHIARLADQPLPLKDLAIVAGLSPFHFQRTFKRIIGVTPKAFQDAERTARLKAGLRAGEAVLSAIFDAGYGSTSRVYEKADERLGMTPSQYRAGGLDEKIVFAVRVTTLGPLMMAATARGVCFAQFGESDAALRRQLAAEFPKARLEPAAPAADEPIARWITAINAHFDQGSPCPELPLDLRGTAFQLRVWQFLITTQPGCTLSYGEIASGIGAPAASRAVGSACGANTIAVLVPCHRALRADGGIGGYRWGLDRKRALIDLERAGALPTGQGPRGQGPGPGPGYA